MFDFQFLHQSRQMADYLSAGMRVAQVSGSDLHCVGSGHEHLYHIFGSAYTSAADDRCVGASVTDLVDHPKGDGEDSRSAVASVAVGQHRLSAVDVNAHTQHRVDET